MDASSQYLSTDRPDRADHLWRYTPWKRIHPTGKISEIPGEFSTPLITLKTLDGSALPSGISLTSGDTDSNELPMDEKITRRFLEAVTEDSKFTLTVAPRFKSSAPIIIEISTGGIFCSAHICLDIGKLAELELVTVLRGNCDWFGMLRTGSTGEGAITSDVVVNRLENGRLLRVESISIPRDSQFKAGTVSSGSTITKADLRYRMFQPGGNLNVLGSILSAREMSLDHHIEIYHDSPETFSRLDWNSACGGSSRTVGTGMLRISKGSNGADAAQLFQNLLLSRDAQADSIPELEVSEHDVVGCGHGTASGPVDREQMFYLESRGMSPNESKSTLIAAFLNSTLSEMGGETMHNWLVSELNSDLNELGD
ncbi:MAG: SufD family Fe-S cluster assembly protein [Candidatus Thalassarchaeaceae archaeon]|tara:strand:+ start:40 stop:1146 length:1107 start_codon:yes stop_codon:yes gene_type:complete